MGGSFEVYSHDRCPLVGWLDRSSQVVPNVLVSGWLSWGSGEGRGPMNTPAGRDGWVISGRKGQKVKGHGLVAVAALSVVTTLW